MISCQLLTKSYGNHLLFQDITLGFFPGERLGLIGPNGSGKTTLLRIFAELETPDSGKIIKKRDTHLVYMPQTDILDPQKSIKETLLASFSEKPEAFDYDPFIRTILKQMNFADLEQKAGTLSGGWKKRLALAEAILKKPDLLLLDEPTNHLDVEGILWLEEFLKNAPFAFVVVSHDRYFLENVSNRIIELNKLFPEGFFKTEGNYSEFLMKRGEFLEVQGKLELSLSNKVRREIEWLRRGPKARGTKAKFRIDDANRMIEDLSELKTRNFNQTVRLDFEATGRRTKKLLELKEVGGSRGDKILFKNLNLVLSPGVCLGVIGSNGAGKTTFLKVLKGDLPSDSGTISYAEDLKIVNFDQKREQLDQTLTLKQALCPAGDSVIFQDKAVHATAWAKRFLFKTEQLSQTISKLSGGEQARVLIANLMLQPADLLLLDEPTNDLDIATLGVLEESLHDFPGAVVLITHDRYLIDRLSDLLLYLDGSGKADYYSDYDQWLESRKPVIDAIPPKKAVQKQAEEKKRKLTYEEQKELNQMEKKIEKAEAVLKGFQEELNSPLNASNPEKLTELLAKIQEAEEKISALYLRWDELEKYAG